MKKKTKVAISISVDKQIANIISDNITNRSKYIEWLIYQDLLKNKIDGIKNILI